MKDIRNHLNKGIGEGAGKITADQAEEAFMQIRDAIRSGSDIPKEAQEILESAKTSYSNQFGSYIINPLAEYIY